MKEEIKNTGIDLRSQVAVLTNSLLEANKTKDLKLQLTSMQSLTDLLANTPGAINALSQLQENRDVLIDKKVLLSRNSRKLISRAVVLGIESTDLKAELTNKVEDAKKKGRDRLTRGDLKDLAQDVKSRLIQRRPVLV